MVQTLEEENLGLLNKNGIPINSMALVSGMKWVGVGNGRIVWANSLFPCGKYSDLKIFQGDMKHALEDDEVVVADGGYADERCVGYGESPSDLRCTL